MDITFNNIKTTFNDWNHLQIHFKSCKSYRYYWSYMFYDKDQAGRDPFLYTF